MTDLLFYDIEVFKHNSMVVFKNEEGETIRVFSSSLDGLGPYVDKGVITHQGYKGLEEYITGKTLVGYNNYFYDDYILYAMSKDLSQEIIKQWNDSIIQNKSMVNMKKIECCKTLDCFQQIDISKPGLKKIEGNMGKSIIESSVDFNLDRPFTPQENLEVLEYCEYDVLQTIEIYKMRQEYFSSKQKIVDMIEDEKLKGRAYKWNTTSIVGQILKPTKRAPSRRLVNDELLDLVPSEVREMWLELDKTIDFKFKKKKVIVEEFGNVVEFGWGGLHGAPKGFVKKENLRLADVASMYPNIIINLNGLGDKTEDYKRILDYRLQLKHEGKKEEQAPYKLILNSTYGLLNNQYSQLNNPHLAFSVCIYGQISLYVLAQRLYGIGAEIININTDGVAYIYDGDQDEVIKRQWEEDFNLTLETENFKKWIQKDVNNYIAVSDNDYIITKGGDVNKYHSNRYFANNDIRITHIALVDNLLYGKPVQDTIKENLDKPILFQYVLQAGSTYQGVVRSIEPEKLLSTKINRVFATKQGGEIVKKRVDGGVVKFADAPNKMAIWNLDLEYLDNFEESVDIQWYYDLVMKNLERWQ